MKEQRLGRSVIVLIVFYLIACGVGFIINFQKGDLQAVGMGVVALLTPWIVPLLFHLLGLRMTQEVWVLDLVFVFFASLIGSCFGGRDHTTVKYAVEKVQDKMQNDAKFKREIEDLLRKLSEG